MLLDCKETVPLSVLFFNQRISLHTFNPGCRFLAILLQPLIRIVDGDLPMFFTLVHVDMIAPSSFRIRIGRPRRRRVPGGSHPGRLVGWETWETDKRELEKDGDSYSASGDRSTCTEPVKEHSTFRASAKSWRSKPPDSVIALILAHSRYPAS